MNKMDEYETDIDNIGTNDELKCSQKSKHIMSKDSSTQSFKMSTNY